MFTRPYLGILLCLCLTQTLKSKNPYDRYDRYRKDEHATPARHEESNKGIPLPSYRATDDSNEDLVEALQEFSDADEDELTLSPLAGVCKNLAQTCSQFALMVEKQNQKSLLVSCTAMRLMGHLSDQEWGGVRGEIYMQDIIEVALSLRDAFRDDLRNDAKVAGKFPLLNTLVAAQEHTNLSTEQFDLEVDAYLRNSLRIPETSRALVTELFNELREYTEQKLHLVLSIFQNDTRKLLDLAMRAPEDTRSPQRTYRTDETGRTMGQRAWLCQHIASTCLDLADNMPVSQNLAQAGPLMQQVQAVLNTMALTYEDLSVEPSSIRQASKHQLATQFASMIDLLTQTGTTRAPHDTSSAYLNKCMALPSVQDKQAFVECAFTSTTERDALLSEFFPALARSLDTNLNLFSSTLAQYTTSTLAKHFWSTPTMKALDEKGTA